ncbi:MAG: polysaccharide biosynthesis protein [Xylanivirga thermophila]|uniref:putative polysaccharide biosynthesis protein n=1 Tax=Xylanivirga thermophila TaxID=2496273 RepID=UPI00101D6CEE|nr:polysaccharide biosynthesis protein [Xylanivirga thermophila]
MSKKSFVKGATILTVAGIVAKIIGALFRIPLGNTIKSEGMGFYQMAYPVYAFLLIVSTAGLPTAISKIVSEKIAVNDYRGAHRVFKVSFRLLTVIGITTTIIMLVGSPLFARMVRNKESIYCFISIAPALFFVSLLSAYRGYFQGMQNMTPTAVSQIVEQFGKLIMGLWLATLWIPNGPQYGAAGAILGVTLSEVAALVLVMGMYRGEKQKIYSNIRRSPKHMYYESTSSIVNRIANIAIPVTIGAAVMPFISFLDSVIVPGRLQYVGFSKREATSLFGILTGMVNPIINLPTVFTIALGMSLVPAIAESYAMKDRKSIVHKTTIGIKLTMLIGVPASIGMAVLSTPICKLLYARIDADEVLLAGNLLMILSIAVAFLTLIQTLTAILQGIGRVKTPVRNLFIGAILKVILTIILVGMPSINIKGAAVSTLVCYATAAILDFIAVIRYTKIPFSFSDFLIKPLLASIIMGGCVYFSYDRIFTALNSNTKATLLSIIIGILVYAIMLLLTGTIREQDLEMLPKGRTIARKLKKIGLLRKS